MLNIESFVHRNFDVVKTYGNPATDLRVNCPYCLDNYGKEDYKQKLHVSLHKQVVHCFKCSYKATWIKFVMDTLGCTYFQALGEIYVKPNPGNMYNLFAKNEITITKPTVIDVDYVGIWSDEKCKYKSAGRKYASGRGIHEDLWPVYNLSVSDELPHRLIIPVEDNYYQARAFYSWMDPKYINPKIPADTFIFNAPALYAYNEVVICEGTISAIHVGLNAVATLGVDVTKAQIRRLIDAPVKHYNIAFDAGAENMSVKLADKLISGGKEVSVWKYADGDPADNINGHKVMDYNLHNKLELLLFM